MPEKIVWRNEIILSKIGQGNEQKTGSAPQKSGGWMDGCESSLSQKMILNCWTDSNQIQNDP